MIDISSKVFDTIFNAVKAEGAYPNADVTTGYDETTAVFPCVVVREADNTPVRNTSTDDCAENHARIQYEVRVYTNDKTTAKTDANRILGIVDTALAGLKFRRIRKNEPLNISRTICCQYGLWEVVVSKPMEIGDDTVYQFYRRW